MAKQKIIQPNGQARFDIRTFSGGIVVKGSLHVTSQTCVYLKIPS
jgi:hypothetical protein